MGMYFGGLLLLRGGSGSFWLFSICSDSRIRSRSNIGRCLQWRIRGDSINSSGVFKNGSESISRSRDLKMI